MAKKTRKDLRPGKISWTIDFDQKLADAIERYRGDYSASGFIRHVMRDWFAKLADPEHGIDPQEIPLPSGFGIKPKMGRPKKASPVGSQAIATDAIPSVERY